MSIIRSTTGVFNFSGTSGIVTSAVQKTGHRGVEQLVARRAHNPEVAGPSPVPATIDKKEELEQSSSFFYLYY